MNEILYWSLYSASAKAIAKKSGHPVQAVLRDAMLLWQFYECPPHEGLWLYWEGCKIDHGTRVLH